MQTDRPWVAEAPSPGDTCSCGRPARYVYVHAGERRLPDCGEHYDRKTGRPAWPGPSVDEVAGIIAEFFGHHVVGSDRELAALILSRVNGRSVQVA